MEKFKTKFCSAKFIKFSQQSSNDVSDKYNECLLHCEDDLPILYCVSIAFDGLARSETKFIQTNLISFMNGTLQAVTMADCNRAAKNTPSQLVLGSNVIAGGNAVFDEKVF